MEKTKIGIALFGCLILGAVIFTNTSLEAKNSDNKDNNEQAYIQDEIISQPEYVQDEILVKYKGDDEPFRVVKVSKGKVEEKVKEYKGRKDVVLAEPNYIFYAMETNDTYYWNQWALNNTGQKIYNKVVLDCIDNGKTAGWCCNKISGAVCRFNGIPDADIDWEESWGTSFPNPEIIIAIVDSGIDETHPDLINKIWTNQDEIPNNGADDDNNGYTDDTWGWDFISVSVVNEDEVIGDNDPHDKYGHGTHVAGIAGAETNNGIGIAGVAFPANIKIMPVQVLNDNYGSSGGTDSVVNGIRYAADNGANVINLSLGGKGDYNSDILREAIDYAYGKGVLIVAAAGNDGKEIERYPASYPNVMSVAGTNYNDNNYSWSTFNDKIDISAPAVNVFSTFPTYEFTIQGLYGRSQNYDVGNGTSMACPHVAGLAGLLFAQSSTRNNDEVRAIIEQTADDLGASGWDKHFGWGRINVHAALTYSPCTSDEDCESAKICCSGKCIVRTCSTDSDCDDGNDCTTDTCIGSGCGCENTWFACSLKEPDECCGPDCTSETDIDCPQTECIKNGRYCNCNGRCDKFESPESCPWDCPEQI